MVDARAHCATAIWGEIMQTWATAGEAAGVIIDGAVRDSAFLMKSSLPIYARAICPRGPLASGEGAVNRPVSCGGIAVHPGDLVVADEDGIVIVRPDEVPDLVDRCRARIAFEAGILDAVREGRSARILFGLPDPVKLPLEG
jgi:regulator of RNase E activity RraA